MVRFTPEILPIMSVYTLFSPVLFVTRRTPNCFKVEHVEVSVSFHLVYLIDCQFILVMSKGTHITIVALMKLIWVFLTELSFILFRVIEFFHSIMSLWTLAFYVAFILQRLSANLWYICAKRSSFVFLIRLSKIFVIEIAPFGVMSILIHARLSLEGL